MNPIIKDKIVIKELESILIAEASGELQFFEYTYFYNYLQDKSLIFKTIILDLNNIELISSTTIGMLLAFVNKKEVKLKLICNKNSKIYKMLSMYRVLNHFNIFSDYESIIESLIGTNK